MKRAILKPSNGKKVLREGIVGCLDDTLPPGFWFYFMGVLNSEALKYAPVTVPRVYPFLVSWVNSNQIQSVLARGERFGLFAVEDRESLYLGPNVPPTAYKVIVPIDPGLPSSPK